MTTLSVPSSGIVCPISGEYTEDVTVTPCGHEFDTSHILEWINRSSSGTAACPICRRDLSIEPLDLDRTHAFSKTIVATARKVIVVFCSAVRTSFRYVMNSVSDFVNNRAYTYCVLLVSWVPSAVDAICLVNRSNVHELQGTKVVRFDRYRGLGEEFTGGVIAGSTICAAELFRQDILSDLSAGPALRRFTKIALDISRMATVLGSPLLAISNYAQLKDLRPVGASLLIGSTVATQAIVVNHTVASHWRGSSSMPDFLNRITFTVLYVCFVSYLIHSFSLSIFSD